MKGDDEEGCDECTAVEARKVRKCDEKRASLLMDEGKLPTAAVKGQVSQHVQPVIDVLRDSITGSLHTFSAYLDDLRFPPTIARKLQDML